MQTLDQEKFNTVKELAEISQQLSIANAEFINLKATTEKYLKIREEEAEKRVIEVLKKSRLALEETTKNHDELSSFNRELKAYANGLKDLAIDITALFQDFNNRMKEAENDLEKNHAIVSDVLKEIKIERVQIKEDRKLLEIERKNIKDERKKLEDRKLMVERAWEEIKNFKNNQKNI